MFRTTATAIGMSAILLAAGSASAQDDSGSGEMASSEGEAMTIADTAMGNEDLSTLVSAVQEAGLAETLSGEGPYTVFAPNNAAFEALPEGALDELMGAPEDLESVLTYHVVEGDMMAADLEDGQTVTTLQGDDLEVSVDGDTVMIGDATVVTPDVEASNGTVHVIDTVLMPDGM